MGAGGAWVAMGWDRDRDRKGCNSALRAAGAGKKIVNHLFFWLVVLCEVCTDMLRAFGSSLFFPFGGRGVFAQFGRSGSWCSWDRGVLASWCLMALCWSVESSGSIDTSVRLNSSLTSQLSAVCHHWATEIGRIGR
jgi:hypothetical protein